MKNHSTREQHLDTSWQYNESQYPDPPDNPEFDLFDEAFQERIAKRFGIGILRADGNNQHAADMLEATIQKNISRQRVADAAGRVLRDVQIDVQLYNTGLITDAKVTNAAKRRTRRAGGVK